jgi:hypothetical protein
LRVAINSLQREREIQMNTKFKTGAIAFGLATVLNVSGIHTQYAFARCKSPFGYGGHLISDLEGLDEGQPGNLVSMDGQVHPRSGGPPISFPGARGYSDGSGENHDDCAMISDKKQDQKQSLPKQLSPNKKNARRISSR